VVVSGCFYEEGYIDIVIDIESALGAAWVVLRRHDVIWQNCEFGGID